MSTLEIVLLIIGALLVFGSFFLSFSDGKTDKETQKMVEEQVKKVVDHEVKDAKDKISDIVDETVSYAVEKTERSLERVSNEKIMAVNEYSDTVLQEINKNHNEVMFLYDMLNDKHKNLTTTASKVEETVKVAEQTMKEAELTVKEIAPNINKLSGSTTEKALNNKSINTDNIDDENDRVSVANDDEQASDSNEFVLLSPKTVSAKKVIKAKNASKSTSKSTSKAASPDSSNLDISFMNDTKLKGNNNEKILLLHKQGKSNISIAKELGLGVGEVKLVIDLFEGI